MSGSVPPDDPGAGRRTGEILQPGFMVAGRYRVDGIVGEGAQSVVYDARHVDLGRSVAVKVVRLGGASALSEATEAVARLRREAQVVSRLGHPNIVQVFDMGTLPGGEAFLVMERLRGRSLSALIQERRLLDEGEAVAIAAQILSALRCAHGEGIVHRDLKPDNIFLHEVGEDTFCLKLLDFGLSMLRAMPKLSRTGTIMGTPLYMAPEQVRGERREQDVRTDLWAVGVILFEMLCGRCPFVAPTIDGIFGQILMIEPPRPAVLRPGLHPGLEMVVLRALAKRPEDRFENAEAMANALARLSGQPITPSGRMMSPLGQPSSAPGLSAGGAPSSAYAVPCAPTVLPGMPMSSHSPGPPAPGGWPAPPQPVPFGPSNPPPTGLVHSPAGSVLQAVPVARSAAQVPAPASRWKGVAIAIAVLGVLAAAGFALLRFLPDESEGGPRATRNEPGSSGSAAGTEPVAVAAGGTASDAASAPVVPDETDGDGKAVEPDAADVPATAVPPPVAPIPEPPEPSCVPVSVPPALRGRIGCSTFRIDRDEVEAGAYARCVRAGVCEGPAAGEAGDSARTAPGPASSVSRAEAERYCGWVGGRLPTRDEWLFAARGTRERRYSWGTRWNPECVKSGGVPSAAGDVPACDVTPEGIRALAGNVAELIDAGTDVVALGGSVRGRNPDAFLLSAERFLGDRDERQPDVGFRCAYDGAGVGGGSVVGEGTGGSRPVVSRPDAGSSGGGTSGRDVGGGGREVSGVADTGPARVPVPPVAGVGTPPSSSEVRRALATLRPRVEACFGGQSGTVSFRATVDCASGRALQIDVQIQAGPASAAGCIRSAISGAALPTSSTCTSYPVPQSWTF